MATIQELMLRAQLLKQETALDSISPERAGGIMYDTLQYINQMQLQGANPLLISKIYASVAAMEADTAPVSDLTGQALRPGQVVVIASSDSDNGSVYRYNGGTESRWTVVGKIGNLTPVDSLDSDSTQLPLAAHQGKVLDEKVSTLGRKLYADQVLSCPAAGSHIFDAPVYAGMVYTFVNAGPSQVNVVSRNGEADVETLKLQLNANESVTVVPTIDAPQIRLYAATGAASVTMSGGEIATINGKIADLQTGEADINTQLNEMQEYPLSVDEIPGYYYNASGVLTSGASFRALHIDDLTGIKKIRFKAGVSSSAYYGFIVNGSFNPKWAYQDDPDGDYPGQNYGYVEKDVPAGATKFLLSWSTSWFQNNDISVTSPYAIQELREEMNGIVSAEQLEKLLSSRFLLEGNLATGGIVAADGSYNTNTAYKHSEFDISNLVVRKISFTETTMGSGVVNYGFVVDGKWFGYNPGVSVATPVTIDVPKGATIIKVCWNRNQINDPDMLVYADGVSTTSQSSRNAPVYQFCPDFVLSRIPSMNCPSGAELGAMTLSELYAKWDALVTAYPQYVTKIDCDAEAQAALGISAPAYMSGLPIYGYKFSPKIGGNGTGVDKTSRVKILVTSMHPQERLGLITMHETIKMVCENWANDVNAEQLRSLVDIYVIPCPWPWNFANNSRVNYNGVNGNRQFPTKYWEESGQGTENWSGTEPLSEYEAKVVNYFLLQIKPDVSVDVHTSGNDNVGHMGILLVNQFDQPLVDLCGVIARTTSNRAIQDNANFPQSDPDKCVYGVYPENGESLGEFYEYAYEQGCLYSILSEESPYSKWSNGTFSPSGPNVEEYTNGILREQVQYLFNTLLRLTRGACVQYYIAE